MMYIVYYEDDYRRKHMTFVRTFEEVKFLERRFGEITVEFYKIKQL